MIDAKWLLLVPLVPTAVFVGWVLFNLSREIWAERRTYGATTIRYREQVSRPQSLRVHHARRSRTGGDLL